MRTLAALLLLSSPSNAWEFTPGLPCLLTHSAPEAEIVLTYDPTVPLYSVTVKRSEPWRGASVFAMQFKGPFSLAISTDRHMLSADGRSVAVEDSGFGNVLNGLQFNDTVSARLGEIEVIFSLAGAADPVAEFRLCEPTPGV